MVYSMYCKQRILYWRRKGLKAPTIAKILLREEGIAVTRVGVHDFIRRVEERGSLMRAPGSGRPSKIVTAVKAIVERQMQDDDETTATQIHAMLSARGYDLSLRTILRCRTSIGWTFRGSAYCQLIRTVNMEKRLAWALEYKDDDFEDVIYTDECTIQMESHRRFCCRKEGQPPRLKPRAKHPFKVHVWAGISKKGRTGICIFTGMMDRFVYIDIIKRTLLPFLNDVYPSGHRLMADNDPKHTSIAAREFLEKNGVNWWRTPAESPNMNPIENLWHEMKEYVRREVKPKTKDELVSGIEEFWKTVDVAKCGKYIGHLKKVIPKVIEVKGAATGY